MKKSFRMLVTVLTLAVLVEAAESDVQITFVGALPPQCVAVHCTLQMADLKSGWLLGRSGLWRTRNGGVSWDAVLDVATSDFTSGRFFDHNFGVILSESKHLYETKDGGVLWTTGSLPHFDGFVQSVWSDAGWAWLGGGEYQNSTEPDAPNYAVERDEKGQWKVLSPIVFRRKGFASTWEKELLPQGAWTVLQLQFWNKQSGVALGDACIYYTDSGGDRWALGTLHSGNEATIGYPGENGRAALYLQSSASGWVSLSGGGLYQTVDGGKDWNLVAFPGTPHFDFLAFTSATRGLGIARESQLYQTIDGGHNWKRQMLDFQPRSLYFLDEHTGWLMSDSGLYRIR